MLVILVMSHLVIFATTSSVGFACGRRLTSKQDGRCISVPMAHFWGQNDVENYSGSYDVGLLHEERPRVELSTLQATAFLLACSENLMRW